MTPLLAIAIGIVVAYVVVAFILHHLFEKVFKTIIFIGTILFALGIIYYVLRGG